MIHITVFRDKNCHIVSFCVEGHSGYAEYGSDVVCSGVSALTVNCVNSIERLTHDRFSCDLNDGGYMFFKLNKGFGRDSQLLLNSMVIGLKNIALDYGAYVKLVEKEVTQ